MVTWILEREVAGSRPLCILCFFIYRFTGAGVKDGDTEPGVECRSRPPQRCTSHMECYQNVEIS